MHFLNQREFLGEKICISKCDFHILTAALMKSYSYRSDCIHVTKQQWLQIKLL